MPAKPHGPPGDGSGDSGSGDSGSGDSGSGGSGSGGSGSGGSGSGGRRSRGGRSRGGRSRGGKEGSDGQGARQPSSYRDVKTLWQFLAFIFGDEGNTDRFMKAYRALLPIALFCLTVIIAVIVMTPDPSAGYKIATYILAAGTSGSSVWYGKNKVSTWQRNRRERAQIEPDRHNDEDDQDQDSSHQ